MNTLIAGAIVTDTHTPSTVEDWMTVLLVGGCILFAFATIVLVSSIDASLVQGVSGGAALAVAFLAMIIGGLNILEHKESDDTNTHYDVLITAIEDTYDLEAIEYTDPDGTPVLGTDERVPDTDALCQPANTNSPQYTGITDGQQVSFKVGVPDCRAENPDIQIVVTKTPGTPLTADQLRKES